MKDIYVNFFYNCLFYMLPSILLNSILCNRVFQFYLGGFLIGLGKAKSTENSVPFLEKKSYIDRIFAYGCILRGIGANQTFTSLLTFPCATKLEYIQERDLSVKRKKLFFFTHLRCEFHNLLHILFKSFSCNQCDAIFIAEND